MALTPRVRALAAAAIVPVSLGLASGISTQARAANIVQRIGPEFQANSVTRSYQSTPTVAAMANGNFAVAWKDDSGRPPDSSTAVRARCFTHAAAPLAPDFVVPATRAGVQREPSAAGLKGGGFVLLWTDDSHGPQDPYYSEVRGQRLTNACAKSGTQFLVNKGHQNEQQQPAVAAKPNGGFIAAFNDWSGLHGDSLSGGVSGQSYAAPPAGGVTRSGAEFRANQTTSWAQEYPSAAGLTTGNSAIVWTDNSGTGADSSFQSIRAQIVLPGGGRLGAERVVNTTTLNDQLNASAAPLPSGRYVVVWEDKSVSGGDTSRLAVRGQIMASSGAKIGPEILVPTKRTNDQELPAVAGFPNGRFVVVWEDHSHSPDDPFESAVRGQIFSPTGQKLGSEFLVNQRKTTAQETPAVAVFNNTDFVVVWTDWSEVPPDDDGAGVRGQVFRLTQ